MRQLKLWKNQKKNHGGQESKGKRKGARPIATKRPMHVTLKSTRARGHWNMLRHASGVENAIHETARRFQVRILRFQNVGNHLHLGLQASTRENFQNFLRVVTQKIMFLITKARKGSPQGRFWRHLAFSRVVEWGPDWRNVKNYFERNRLEAEGMPRDVVDFWCRLRQTEAPS